MLRSRTIGEDDLLVEFLTPQYGRVHGIARHGRKSHKRFGPVLEPLNIVRLSYRDGGGLVSLREAVLADPLIRLENDLERLAEGLYFIDLIRQWAPERNPDPRLYILLKESLQALSDGAAVLKLVARFEYRLLDLAGLKPNLEGCSDCGRPHEAGTFYFVFTDGGIFCGNCLPVGKAHEEWTPPREPEILRRFIEFQLGKPLRSRKLLTEGSLSG